MPHSILRSLSLMVFAFVVVCAATASGQNDTGAVHIEPQVEPSRSTEVTHSIFGTHTKPFKVNVDLVLVPVTVIDPTNRLVTGLGKENFTVFEGKQQQEIKSFSGEDTPVSIGLIFDMSGSMSTKIRRACEAVSVFIKTANPQDEFFLITFNDRPEELSDFTSSVEDVQSKLLYVVPKGRTALLDAIYVGINKMRRAKYQRKALLIISDGGDNHSRYSEHEITSVVREADVLVYAIGIYDHYFPTQEERLGPGLLSEITEVTGGRAFAVDDPDNLTDVASKIGTELRNQYVIAYRPAGSAHDGKWHKIKVKVIPPKGLSKLQVYARTGYYASTE
jgi:Ca-activated chloride channel family protein